MESTSSNIFEGYRSVGYVTNSLPFIVRHTKNPQDARIVTIVGRTFHTYSINLSLIDVSIPHEQDIQCLISDTNHVYSVAGKCIFCWGQGSKTIVYRLNNGHQADVKYISKTIADRLVSIDANNVIVYWDLANKKVLSTINKDAAKFKICSLCHPKNYNEKVLLGSEQGSLQLLNLQNESVLYEFSGWKSPVRCIVQSPVVDVVGIGLEDGHIHIHNIKYDENMLKIYQEYGAITSLSFRLDGQPYLVSTSEVGHVIIWNLERKRLSTQIRDAHSGPISKCQFIVGTSYLVTSGTDNSVKIWSMDMSDGGGNLLCQRSGHSAPPSQIRFYGPKGFNLLSAGMDSSLKMFHLYSERLNRNLGTARMNPKSKHKENFEINRLPPITCFASEPTREKQWDNIVACHKGLSLLTSWNYDKCRMGDHIIIQPTFDKHDVKANCVCITSCGNFFVVGFSNGLMFKYNLQSGIFRHSFEIDSESNQKAHEGSIESVTVDGLSLVLISGGDDAKLRLWNFKSGALLMTWDCPSPITRFELHKDNNLLAVALKNHDIEIRDLEGRTLVRKFSFRSPVLDMTFSPDSRWLIVSHADKSIRTWDLSLGKLIDAFQLEHACKSLAISPTGEFLATAFDESLGITIWCNYTIYCPTNLRAIDPDQKPMKLQMPFVKSDDSTYNNDDDDDDNDNQADQHSGDKVLSDQNDDGLSEPSYVSPEQLGEDMITMSGLAASRWKNLLFIDEIREKQLIAEKENNAKMIKVPFFIPVKDGLQPKLDVDPIKRSIQEQEALDAASKINQLNLLSSLARTLIRCGSTNDFDEFFNELKELGPSATDVEIRSLGSDTSGDNNAMLCFLEAIEWKLLQRTDFELVNSWLALFLKAHSDLIQKDKEVQEKCSELNDLIGLEWDKLRGLYDQVFCVLNYIRSSIL